MVTGRDPVGGKAGGSAYVRTHALAARRAGFEPHVFCLGPRNQVVNETIGVVHRVAAPAWLFGGFPAGRTGPGMARQWLYQDGLSPYGVAFFERRLARGVGSFVSPLRGPHLVHGFYTWGCVGLRLRRELARRGVRDGVRVVTSIYTVAAHEAVSKARAVRRFGAWPWLLGTAEKAWIHAAVAPYERWAYRRSDRVLLNYESVRRLLVAAHGDGAPVRTVAYSCESAFADSPPRHRSGALPLRLVCLSRHDPRKGVDVLLRALVALRPSAATVRATILSGGPLIESHRRLVAAAGLGDIVDFTDWVADPGGYLAAADIFVLPSLEEGSGSLALLEAMQAGLAIVASAVDGIPEDVVNEDNGLLVPPGDPAALAAAIGRVLSDGVLRRRLARRARETHEQRFSAASFSRALGSQYAELLQR